MIILRSCWGMRWVTLRVRKSQGHSFKRPQYFLGFTSKYPTRFSVKMWERFPYDCGSWRETIVIVEYAQSILHNKGLLSKKRDLIRVLWSYPSWERYLHTPFPCSLPVSSNLGGVINRSQENRLRTLQPRKEVGESGKSNMTRERLVKVTAPLDFNKTLHNVFPSPYLNRTPTGSHVIKQITAARHRFSLRSTYGNSNQKERKLRMWKK